MNIFVLDYEPKRAAQYHCDKHAVKMILESAQMLSTVLNRGYKPTHRNHPCTLWLTQSRENAEWLYELNEQLNLECQQRFCHKRDHSSWALIRDGLARYFNELPDVAMTPFALAMPEVYKSNYGDDAVSAYRNYYIHEKRSIASWSNKTPDWWPSDAEYEYIQ
jgi:hypothetical protein